jgi:predicted amidohydrolase YtcJ
MKQIIILLLMIFSFPSSLTLRRASNLLVFLFYIFLISLPFNQFSYSQQMKTTFINGNVFTVNDNQPYAEAVVVENGLIKFVGSTNKANKYIDDRTEVIDLQGKLMLPGFIDSHLHFTSGGYYLLGINLRPALSKEEFVFLLRDYVKDKEGRWITGGRWDHESWQNKSLPTKELIDSITLNTPVFVSRIDGHMGLANSKALELAGITSSTLNPAGGLIVKDPETGEPTGILKDNAMDLVFNIIPDKSIEENIEAALRSLEEARKLGITSVHDITQPDELEAYNEIENMGELTCRIYSILPINTFDELVRSGITAGNDVGLIKRGGLKAYADGSLGASTAWFFEPYIQDTTTVGLPMEIVTNGDLEKWGIEADRNRLQLCVHAIGDRANSFMLDLYERIIKNNSPWERRFRIEHAQHLRYSDIKRFSKLDVIASVQPYHCIDDGVWAEKRIGKERLKYTHPYKSFLDNNVMVAFGTDWPVAPLNPLFGIYAAVTRRTVDNKNPGGWIPEQKISVEEAIKCYTLNAAYTSFEENIKGSIKVGKLADLVVLSDDILTIDPIRIKDIKVNMTIFNGEIIYRASE